MTRSISIDNLSPHGSSISDPAGSQSWTLPAGEQVSFDVSQELYERLEPQLVQLELKEKNGDKCFAVEVEE